MIKLVKGHALFFPTLIPIPISIFGIAQINILWLSTDFFSIPFYVSITRLRCCGVAISPHRGIPGPPWSQEICQQPVESWFHSTHRQQNHLLWTVLLRIRRLERLWELWVTGKHWHQRLTHVYWVFDLIVFSTQALCGHTCCSRGQAWDIWLPSINLNYPHNTNNKAGKKQQTGCKKRQLSKQLLQV